MNFATPTALLLLPLLAGLWWLSRRRGQARQAALQFSDLNLVRLHGAVLPSWENHLPFALSALALVCLIFALARPQVGITKSFIKSNGLDIMMCLDTSGSMNAQDLTPSRVAAATAVGEQFVRQRPDDRIGLVVFSGVALSQCPLTTDHAALLTAMNTTKVGVTHTDGTAIGSAIATCINRLKDVPGKSKVIILLTDGSNNAGEIDPVKAAEMAAKYNIKIYTIGVGTDGPAPITVSDPLMGERTVMMPADMDEGVLRKIAEATGGQFFRATDSEALQGVYAQINRLEKRSQPKTEVVAHREIYAWFAFPALGLLALNTLLARKELM
jgi:Ca-activated chloride channel family protein